MIDTTNKYLISLEDKACLWRYIDLDKFNSLLTSKSLFFCRVDNFEDNYEGSIPTKEYNYLNKKPNHIREGFAETYKEFRRSSVVSCWHISENESKFMWDLYSKKKGIAIKTNKERLFESIKSCKENIWASKIRYINYDDDSWYGEDYPYPLSFLSPLIHKRIEYKEEREFRLIIHREEIIKDKEYWDKQPFKSGILVEVDILNLIDRIILSPNIETEMKNIITEKASSFGVIVEDSRLSKPPLF